MYELILSILSMRRGWRLLFLLLVLTACTSVAWHTSLHLSKPQPGNGVGTNEVTLPKWLWGASESIFSIVEPQQVSDKITALFVLINLWRSPPSKGLRITFQRKTRELWKKANGLYYKLIPSPADPLISWLALPSEGSVSSINPSELEDWHIFFLNNLTFSGVNRK